MNSHNRLADQVAHGEDLVLLAQLPLVLRDGVGDHDLTVAPGVHEEGFETCFVRRDAEPEQVTVSTL